MGRRWDSSIARQVIEDDGPGEAIAPVVILAFAGPLFGFGFFELGGYIRLLAAEGFNVIGGFLAGHFGIPPF